jgi:PAS domain S-box-containing protein
MTAPEKVNILLVDDQPSKLLSYEVILQDLGENLLKASSGTEALERLLKHEVAVVLVDVCMPDLDGFELAAMIREHPRCQKTAIIFISAIHLTDVDRLRGYEMGAVDYVPVPVVPEVLRAKVRIFTELYRKTRQLEEFNKELENRVAERTAELQSYTSMLLKSEERRTLALAAGKMGAWDWDLTTGDCIWDEGHCQIFGVNHETFKVTAESLADLLEPEDWDQLKHIWSHGGPAKQSHEAEFRVRRPNGEIRWCVGTAAATMDGNNNIVRISGVTTDITDRKQAEERQAFLAREVDHRARNVLAVVQSILRLTKADNAKEYVGVVEGRIRALSAAHMLLSESRWAGADLGRLLGEELEPYRTDESGIVSLAGPETLLDPRRAQTIALAVHELATNAAKYGALSTPSGKVSLDWKRGADGLVIDWLEMGGPEVVAPSSQGYGTRVIRASLEQLGGQASFDWRAEGLRCTLSLPYGEAPRASNGGGVQAPADRGTRHLPQLVAGNTIMLVEDEPVVALMMAETLGGLGFRVSGPYGGLPEALTAAVETPIDGAILDMNLNGSLVYPVADILKARGIPFVFITGYGTESIDQRYGQVPLLQKPIDRNALIGLFVVAGSPMRGSPAKDPTVTQAIQ